LTRVDDFIVSPCEVELRHSEKVMYADCLMQSAILGARRAIVTEPRNATVQRFAQLSPTSTTVPRPAKVSS